MDAAGRADEAGFARGGVQPWRARLPWSLRAPSGPIPCARRVGVGGRCSCDAPALKGLLVSDAAISQDRACSRGVESVRRGNRGAASGEFAKRQRAGVAGAPEQKRARVGAARRGALSRRADDAGSMVSEGAVACARGACAFFSRAAAEWAPW